MSGKPTPEKLLEEAKKCKTKEELNDFLSNNSIQLPLDVLDRVTGGKNDEAGYRCEVCGEWFEGYFCGYWEIIYHYLDHYTKDEMDLF